MLTGISADDPIMDEEIFGPILPVLRVRSTDDAIGFVAVRDKPLALYIFSEQRSEVRHVLDSTSSGGVTVNGTVLHMSNPHLPFGGVGSSGIGAYHGRFGFDTFSHRRAVLTRGTRIDPGVTYPPAPPNQVRRLARLQRLRDPRDVIASARNTLLGRNRS